MPRLKDKYTAEVVPAMIAKFGYKNIMEVPKLVKIVLNSGVGDARDNARAIEVAAEEMTKIAGQRAMITTARKSVANFKLRQGMKIGVKVTLRGDRMYYYMDKLINIALPRVRDFRGVPTKSFDGRGNYAMGVKEQLIYPEINYSDVEKIRGMDIIFVTTAKTDEEGRELLKLMGMPFAQNS